MSTPVSTPIAYPIDRAVALAGCGRSTLYELMRVGELPFVKIGKRTLILDADLRALLVRHRKQLSGATPPEVAR